MVVFDIEYVTFFINLLLLAVSWATRGLVPIINQQHEFTNLVDRATANCTVAPNIFNMLIADPFLTSEMRIIKHPPC
jgi:hypothetical protein